MTKDFKNAKDLSLEAVTESDAPADARADNQEVFSLAAETDLHQFKKWLEGDLVASLPRLKSLRSVVVGMLGGYCQAKEINEKELQAEIREGVRDGEIAVRVTVSRGFLNSGDLFSGREDFGRGFHDFFYRVVDLSNLPVANAETHWTDIAKNHLQDEENAHALVDAAMMLSRESGKLPKKLKVMTAAGESDESFKDLTLQCAGLKAVNTLPFEVTGEVPMVFVGYEFLQLCLFACPLNDRGKRREISISDEQLREIRGLVDGRTVCHVQLSGRSSRRDADIFEAAELKFVGVSSHPGSSREK